MKTRNNISIIAYHGIGAYVGQKNPMALRRMLTTALSGVELCVSERAIGAFGAVFEGECTAAFGGDVWSKVGIDGSRYTEQVEDFYEAPEDADDQWQFEPRFEPVGVVQKKPISQSDWEDYAKTRRAPHSRYTEAWMCPSRLCALWVKKWAPVATVNAARVLANSHNVPLFLVDGEGDKIWDLLDDVALWGDKYPRHHTGEVTDHNPLRCGKVNNDAFSRFFGEQA